jgi:precorrin-8X/cobalt-precorrin-8 methylmutase
VNFISEPRAIEIKSMAIIDQLLGAAFWREEEKVIVKRIIHATGDPDLARLVVIHPGAVQAAFAVFSAGKKIITDVKMVKAGINLNKTRKDDIEIYCAIDEPAVVREATAQKQTRAMVAIRHLAKFTTGNMVVIGNAPTALWELINLIKAGKVKPAVIIATPVGFVGAAEAKEALGRLTLPYITVHGTKGGSPIAVSVVNALYKLYLENIIN